MRARRAAAAARMNYPDGYRVDVEGASVESRRDAPVLRLEAARGVDDIGVRVAPRR